MCRALLSLPGACREDAPIALLVPAPPAADPQLHRCRLPLDRKVPQAAYVRTVSSPRYRAAPRADRFADGDRLDHPSAIVTLGAKNLYVGAKHPHPLAFHQSPCQLHPDMVRWTMTCTELEEDPQLQHNQELQSPKFSSSTTQVRPMWRKSHL